jgi:hypothetical protein
VHDVTVVSANLRLANLTDSKVRKFHRGLYGSTGVTVGTIVPREYIHPYTYPFSIYTQGSALSPDGVVFLYNAIVGRTTYQVQVWTHTYEGETTINVPQVNALSAGRAGEDVSLSYSGTGWTYSGLQFRAASSLQARLQVFRVDLGDTGSIT